MNHLPLPRNPVIGALDVPFLCNEAYDGGPFLTYPTRTGWNITEDNWPEILTRHGREITDESGIGSFLQMWLYLGLLCEITGNIIEPATFRAPGRRRSAPLFSSKHLPVILGQWSVDMSRISEEDEDISRNADESALRSNHPVTLWVSKQQNILNVAEGIWEAVIEAYQDRSSAVLDLTCLSIAALGNYLTQALADIAGERGIGYGHPSNGWLLPQSVCQPLFRRMQKWCPNRLHALFGSCSVGLLWYMANLEPPTVSDDHQTCTPNECCSLYVDAYIYRIKHVLTDCHCARKGPSPSALARIVHGGSIGLFKVLDDSGKVKLALLDETSNEGFVAISHVWADGHGNLEANELPECVLKRLQRDVNALEISKPQESHTPIWMDTICLPRRPLALRTKAILRLSDVFVRASGVLVLDAYLQALDISDLSPMEILARVSISGWTSRLWTFSEGRLARRIWVQFRNKAIDLYGLMNSWYQELTVRVPSTPLTSVAYDMTTLYTATTLSISGPDKGAPLSLGDIKKALTSRQTSWPSDEALCLAAILGLDLSKVAAADDDKKMAAFWRQVEFVPVELIFYKVAQKLEDPGCRWAPTTMLGGADSDLKSLGTFELSTDNGQQVLLHLDWKAFIPSVEGLKFILGRKFSVAALCPFSENAKSSLHSKRNFIDICRRPDAFTAGKAVMLKDKDGHWYRCLIREPWHQTPIIPDCEHEMPILFVLKVDPTVNLGFRKDQNHSNQHQAVFATYKPSKDTFIARVHTHVAFTRLPEGLWQVFNNLLLDAAAFNRQYQQDIPTGKYNDHEIIGSIIDWLAKTYAEDALINRVAGVLPPDLGDPDIELILKMCARYIQYFMLVDGWCNVEILEPDESAWWCID